MDYFLRVLLNYQYKIYDLPACKYENWNSSDSHLPHIAHLCN